MNTTETPAVTLDSADLSISAYRALREGKDATVTTPAATEVQTPAAEAVETEAEADAAGHSGADDLEDSSKESKAPKKDKISGRFSELTAKIKTLETQLAAKNGSTGQSESTESKSVNVPKLPPDPKDPEPDASKFADYVEWQKAWNRWDRRQDQRQETAARAAAEQQHAAKAKSDSFQARVTEAKSEFADFDTVAFNKDLPVSPVMADAITDSEIGPKILYHLGKNPAEAARIAKLSAVAQVREIGKLEAKLDADAAGAAEGDDAEEPQTKKPAVSKAPVPHKPLGSGAAVNPAKLLDSMSQRDYRALRESGKLR